MTALGRSRSINTWFPLVVVGGVSLVVLLTLNPLLLLSSTTPTGGDMGAHVFGPAYLRDVLLPEGRILGWSNDWFAGFPAFYFYFPLPSLLIVALDVLIPYGVAFKLVTVLGLLATPPAAYFLARSMDLGRFRAMIASGAGVVFLFMESFTIYGGNVASTLAGEFSYSWSLALTLIYFGFLFKALRHDRRYLKWAALALAATALSHILTTIVAVIASLAVLPWRKAPRLALIIWGWGFAIAAFWALPLLARIGLSSDMAWTPLSRWEEVFPLELWILLPAAIGGAVWAWRRTPTAGPLIVATLIPVIYYPLPRLLPAVLPSIFDGERWKLWNGRLLPFWYFGVAFFAAIGLGTAVVWVARRLPSRISTHWPRALIALAGIVGTGLIVASSDFPDGAEYWSALGAVMVLGATFLWSSMVDTRRFLAAATVGVLALGALAGVTFIDGWSRWNYEGYEAKEPWPEYEALMSEIQALPPGRVHWEANSVSGTGLNRYGTPMSPMLIPYWTQGTHASMEGLFFESSLTTPFHFLNSAEMAKSPSNPIPGLNYHTFNMERGVKHLTFFGVTYYVAYTPEATEKADTMSELTKLAEVPRMFPVSGEEGVTTPRFTVYQLPETSFVEVAAYQPAVYEGTANFHEFALEWYDDVDSLDRWVAADGPSSWPRITELEERPDQPLVSSGAVSDVVIDNHRISFNTSAVGVPHLVKVSYFPNWQAEGAEGPWRASPSLMMVVPTADEVVLSFEDTWAETTGKALTVGGVGALVILAIAGRRRTSQDRRIRRRRKMPRRVRGTRFRSEDRARRISSTTTGTSTIR